MSFQSNCVLKGAKGAYRLLEPLKSNTVFKAKSVHVSDAESRLQVSIPPAVRACPQLIDYSFMIKSAPPLTPQESIQRTPGQQSPAMERIALVREYEIYVGPGPVKTNPFIRKLHDVVGQWEMVEGRGRAGFDKTSEDPPCLVFEWMEHVLWKVRAEPYRENSVLPKVIARSVLEALDITASANAMHTG